GFRCEELLKPAPEGNADLLFLVPYSIPPCITGVSTTRRHPLAIRHPVDVKHTIRVNPDEPRQVVIPKQPVASEFFWFSFTTTTSRTESVHVFTFQSKMGIVPRNKVRNYSGDLAKVADAINWHIRFRPRGRKPFRMSGSSNSPASW
ncbi:MAG TPA: hypothetical protein VF258_11485, partial [Luteolibacter sp.]